jgi:hypothetical protein
MTEMPMHDTYHSGAQAEVDRAQQKLMLVALNNFGAIQQ